MSQKDTPIFTMLVADEQLARLKVLAKRAGLTPQQWLDREASKCARRLFTGSDELSPKEAGLELGVSSFTAIRYFHQNRFEGAYLLTPRTIRIPRSAVEKLKADRMLVAS